MEALRNLMKIFSWDNRCLGRDSNLGLPDCKSKALPLLKRSPVDGVSEVLSEETQNKIKV
jgi:hypothetical protein